MAPEFTEKTLVERAVTLLQTARSGKVNRELLSWINVIHEYGFADACRRTPKLAGKFNDWSVTEAIGVILEDERWPGRQQKIEAVAEILSGQKTKAEIRSIAILGQDPGA